MMGSMSMLTSSSRSTASAGRSPNRIDDHDARAFGLHQLAEQLDVIEVVQIPPPVRLRRQGVEANSLGG